ncbi:MAG: GatB/YqeY domain-containing protein [Candidatus Puniceispirillaceae bacterium]
MRERIAQAMKDALKSKDQATLSTIRLIVAALKDRDIAARSDNNHDGISDDEILSMLQTMIKQRNESAKMYEDGGRPELAEAEKAEIELIQQFLPEQLSHDDIEKAIADAIAQTSAASIKDMGKVMAHLKEQYAGQMDFSAASQMVKTALMG